MIKNIKYSLLILFLFVIQQSFSQKQDSVKIKKNLQFSFVGGPGYTPDYGLLIGGNALFTFSINKKEQKLKRSVLPVSFSYMFTGGGNIIILPQLYFKKNNIRIYGEVKLNSTINNYYGVGYEKNSTMPRNKDSTEYRDIGYKINPILYFRFKQTNLYWGASIDISQQSMQKPSIGVQNDSVYISEGGTRNGLHYTNVGFGANFSYDTRDVPANAYNGSLFEFSFTIYSKTIGSSSDYSIYNLLYKYYKELKFLGKRKIFAGMLKGRFSARDVPITSLSTIGSPFDLRGYYMGQYRGNNAFTGVAEYRHMFNAGNNTLFTKLLSKLGFVIWGGAGIIDPKKNSFKILPNYGLGLRIEVQHRMNFRIDVGQSPIDKQTLFYFNMTEAF